MKQQTSFRSVRRLTALLLVAVLLLSTLVIGASAAPRITITRIEWQNTESLVYGSAKTLKVIAYDANDNAYTDLYAVQYPAGYGNVNEEGYTVEAVLIDPSFDEATDIVHTKHVTIAPKEYGVFMEDLTVAGDGFSPYIIPVTGSDNEGNAIPYGVQMLIQYTVDGKPFNGTADFGVYKITANLPVGNYRFYSGGTPVNSISATLTINREMEVVDVKDTAGKTAFIVLLSSDPAQDGSKSGLSKTITATGTLAENLKAPKNTKYAQSFQLHVLGASENETFSVIVPLTETVYQKGCGDINPKTAVYIYDENGTPVSARSLGYSASASRGYVKISGIPGTVGTLTVSIAPRYSNGLSPWWILLIVLIIFIILLVVFFFIGRALAKKKAEEAPAPQEPEEPEEEPAVEVMAPVPTPAPAPAPEPEADDDFDVDLAQPAMRGLVYIDVVKKPEEYGRMLVKEEAGEGVVVYRYRKSYLAKLALADGKIGEYYSIVKNALLHFRGVKARKSWNYEAFNQGRNQIAKIIPNGKTLYLYLAIDPKTLEGTKYGAIDVSDKKKFEVTPSLMKIRGDRKLKFALELIEKICGEMLALKPLDEPDVDYKPTYQSAEKLFDNGLIRKMAALAPLPEKEEQ